MNEVSKIHVAEAGTTTSYNYRVFGGAGDWSRLTDLGSGFTTRRSTPWDTLQSVACRRIVSPIDNAPCIVEMMSEKHLEPIDLIAAILKQRSELLAMLHSEAETAAGQLASLKAEAVAESLMREILYRYVYTVPGSVTDDNPNGTLVVPLWQNITANRRLGVQTFTKVIPGNPEKGIAPDTRSIVRVAMLEGVLKYVLQHAPAGVTVQEIIDYASDRMSTVDWTVCIQHVEPRTFDADDDEHSYLRIQMLENEAGKVGALATDESDKLIGLSYLWNKFPPAKRAGGDSVAFGGVIPQRGTRQKIHATLKLNTEYDETEMLQRLTDPTRKDYRDFKKLDRDALMSLLMRHYGGEKLEKHNETRKNAKLPPVAALTDGGPITAYLNTLVYATKAAVGEKAIAGPVIHELAEAYPTGNVRELLHCIASGDKTGATAILQTRQDAFKLLGKVPNGKMAELIAGLKSLVATLVPPPVETAITEPTTAPASGTMETSPEVQTPPVGDAEAIGEGIGFSADIPADDVSEFDGPEYSEVPEPQADATPRKGKGKGKGKA